MFTDSTLQVIWDLDPYRGSDDTQYPGNWDKNTIPGLFPVTETPQPDPNSFVVTSFVIENQDDEYIQVWQSREFTADEIEARKKNARELAIRAKWPTETDRINDMFTRGFDPVKADYDAIIEAVDNPQPGEFSHD